MSPDPIAELKGLLEAAVEKVSGGHSVELSLERPRRSEQGDYSSNVAMLVAGVLREAPPAIAKRLAEDLSARLGPRSERIEVANPGFLNLFLADRWYRESVEAVLSKDSFGRSGPRKPGVLLEFVSANPTGPLTAAGGRGAAYGDSLARVLDAAGHDVSREYYVNDAGAQVRAFAASIAARMRGEEVGESGYSGRYVEDLAGELAAAGATEDDPDELARLGVEAMRRRIEATLTRFGVNFDTWSSERQLHEAGALEATLGQLESDGHVYESDGALWLRTTALGDDKDRVLIRSDGEPTYFASDVAYHRDKLERGAEQMIVPLGADHHGYVPRMKAAVAMMTGDPDRYEAPIMQLVNIVESGKRTQMSKRRGEFVTLDELMDDIGADAARFFLLARSNDTVIDLDLELARSESQENPVYYVQYAYARVANILRKAEEENGLEPDGIRELLLSSGSRARCEPTERALIRRLLELPQEIQVAADRRAPHRMCSFAQAVAADFHGFYRDCKVVGADAETGVSGTELARLGVCLAAKHVLGTCLSLIGVGAPERM